MSALLFYWVEKSKKVLKTMIISFRIDLIRR